MSMQILKRIFILTATLLPAVVAAEGASGYDCLIEPESEGEKATLALATARIDMDAEPRLRQVSTGFARRKLVQIDD